MEKRVKESAGDLVKTLLIKFRVAEDLRFLSHQEMMRVWLRALMRSGVSLRFSSGFNPHPKISLPLPRNVGVVSHEDIACVQLEIPDDAQQLESDSILQSLSSQMPPDLKLLSLEVLDGTISPQPQGAVYEVPTVDAAAVSNAVSALNEKLASGKPLLVKRLVDVKKGITQTRDVSEFIESVSVEDSVLRWKTKIKPTGSIRVEEIFELLGLEADQLGSPVVRKEIEWKF